MNLVPPPDDAPRNGELTLIQRGLKQKCEATIERGLKTFLDVGHALQTMRAQRLYRETHRNFESYCQERWSISASRARQLADAAVAADEIEKSVTHVTPPQNEAQVRPLLRLPPKKRAAAWERAVRNAEGDAPTQKEVAAAADAIEPPSFKVDPVRPYGALSDLMAALTSVSLHGVREISDRLNRGLWNSGHLLDWSAKLREAIEELQKLLVEVEEIANHFHSESEKE